MLVFFLLCFLLIFNFPVFSYDFFVQPEKFKSSHFFYPVVTFNIESGSRYSYLPDEEITEDDFQIVDSYNFKLGYFQILQQITRVSKVRLKYKFNIKEYDINTELNNKANTYSGSVVYEIIPKLLALISIRYKLKDFSFNSAKNNTLFSPGVEIRFKPDKGVIIGFKYTYFDLAYPDADNDATGNRFLAYWQEFFLENKLKIRVRYRGESRKYLYPTSQRKSSYKQSVSFTLMYDFNK